jgi:hypothetical protein
VKEVLSDDGAGSDDSVLDQGRWDEGDIVGVSAGGGRK